MTTAFFDFLIFGVQPPRPGYFSSLVAEAQNEDRFTKLLRIKAMLTLVDTMEYLEAA
jgi:hypothetical protein